MDDNEIERPILAKHSESQHQLKKTPSERKFRRVKTTPSMDSSSVSLRHAENVNNQRFSAKKLFKKIRPSFKLVAAILCVYLIVFVTVFYLLMDQISGQKTNRFLDALYFCITTMTSVGYGDLFPHSDTMKLISCFVVFSGMALIAGFLSKSADYFVGKQEVMILKAFKHRMGGEARMLRALETNEVRFKFYTIAVSLLLIMFGGTMFLWKVEHLTLVDSFYCVCATITTLGYGDASFKSVGGRIFAVIWILAGCVTVVQFFFYLAELSTENRQKKLTKWVLKRRMNKTDLEAMDLLGTGDHHEITPSEFVLFKLKEIRKISEQDIEPFLEEFLRLDVDQSGTLSVHDLAVAQEV